jgi:hypothetical protein
MMNKTVERFNDEVHKLAKNRVIKKLKKQGIDSILLADKELEELVTDEMEILKSETQKIGVASGISVCISLFIGV